MSKDENDDLRTMLARIEANQAVMSHELSELRAGIAMLASRQNSKIGDTKKKPTGSPGLYRHLPTVS